jgi:gamma-glutamyltranspeptidase/glutathione hydrolase
MTRRNRGSPRRGIVAAPQAEAAYEGARVLAAGGNAADALVSAAFVQGVVDPHRSGAGGFGCSTVFFPAPPRGGGGAPHALAIDFHGRAGKHVRPDQWESIFESAAPDGFGYVVKGKINDVGYGAITVPGMIAGLSEIHRRYGTLPWRELVLRAVPYAADGFLVTPELAEFWIRPGLHGRVSTRERLSHTPTGTAICLKPDGSTYKAGEIFRQPILAETYRRLAEEGPDSFYRGSLGAAIAADWERHGALVTREDLESYRPEVREPLAGAYAGLQLLTTPLPGGGVALLQALRLLEGVDLPALGHNTPDYIDAVAPVLAAVWSDRLTHQGDPKFGGLSTEQLLADDYVRALRAGQGAPAGADSESTTQLSIVDREGNAISFCHSLGYGSGVFTEGLGFMYNNCMSAFDPRPHRRNSAAPGKARSTAVAETILLEDGRARLVLGSPGAARITAGLVQAILNVVAFDMTAAEAVVHPRFDAYGERKLVLESRFPQPLVSELRARGWDVLQSAKPFGVVGRVYAVDLDPTGVRTPIAAVDPGSPGAAYLH